MSVISLSYSELDQTARFAERLSQDARNYSNELRTRVSNKLDSLPGNDSSYTNQAQTYLSSKMKKMQQKEEHFTGVARSVRGFRETAANTDKRVAVRFRRMFTDLVKDQNISIGPVEAFLAWNWTGFTNSSTLGKVLGQTGRTVDTLIDQTGARFKSWFETEGGKYAWEVVKDIIDAAGAILVLVSAIAAAVAATVLTAGGAVVLIAAAVAAALALVNLVVSSSFDSAAGFSVNSNPENAGEAHRMSKIDTCSDYMRSVNTGDAEKNKFLDSAAMVWDGTQLAADLALMVSNMGKFKSRSFKFSDTDVGKLFIRKNLNGKKIITWNSLGEGLSAIKRDGTSNWGALNKIMETWKGTKSTDSFLKAKDTLGDLKTMGDFTAHFVDKQYNFQSLIKGDGIRFMQSNIDKTPSTLWKMGENLLEKSAIYEGAERIVSQDISRLRKSFK